MNILDKILETKKEEVKKLKQNFTLSRFKDSSFYENDSLNFQNALSEKNEIAIISEIKKASPSKGVICNNFNHLRIAETYFENETSAISILTDQNYFQGSLTFLNEIAQIKTSPLLRKDFLIDEYQIYESKSNGADAVLLICEALSKSQIAELTYAALENNLTVLLELHSEDQLAKIDFSLNKIIGINNRDLTNFETDLTTTQKLSLKLPEDTIVVSESGINSKSDIDFLKSINTNAILVGEHFMKSASISDSVKQFKEWCQYES